MSVLTVEHLSYRYDKNVPVLEDLSLTINSEERIALLGPSGYGKSTLGLLLAGYLPMQKGRVLLDGNPVPKGAYCPIQLIYQHPEKAMNPRWKLQETLDEAWDVPEELLTAIGANPSWLTRWPNELSGGQLQRLSILRALSPATKLLIADEITASLDPITQAQIWQVILQEVEKNGTSLLVITHNEALAKRISTKIVHIKDINHLG